MTNASAPFESAVADQVRRLGGTVAVTSTQTGGRTSDGPLALAEAVQLIRFPKPLLSAITADSVLDQFAEAGVAADAAIAAMRDGDGKWDLGLIWQAPGVATADRSTEETALLPLLDVARHYPEVLPEVEQACGAGTREIVYLGYREGYPNYTFVRANDPNPANPEVFTTDHELFLREIEPEGTLSEYLAQMLTDESVYQVLRDGLA